MDTQKQKHIIAITAVICRDNKFLVVQRGPNEIAFPDKWVFPGGKLETGETIMDTLKREVREEVNLEIEETKNLVDDTTFVRPDGHNVVVMTFLVIVKAGDIKISSDLQAYRWIAIDELKNTDCVNAETMERAIRNSLRYL